MSKKTKINKKNIIVKSMLLAVLVNCTGPYLHAATVSELQDDVEQQNSQIAATDKEINAKQAEISKLNNSVERLDKELESKRNEITENQEKLTKIQDEISSKEEEIAKLQDDLQEHKEHSSSFLGALQKNSNVNYFLQIMSNDSMDTKSKLTSFHGLNILANDSYDMLMQTAKLQNKVESSEQELVAQQSKLEERQTIIASDSDELLQKSQEQAKQKAQIMQEVTEMSNANESQKKDLLADANLLQDYKNSGCSGNDVYGVDCAVPVETTTEEVTTKEVTTEEATTKTAKVKKLAAQETTTKEATTKEVTTEEATTKEATTKEVTTEEATTEATTQEITTEAPTTEEATTEATTASTSGGSYFAKLQADPNASYIIQKESGWNPYATNASSGAYGLCQAKPASKMASAGSDWATNPETQAKWCDSYAMERYGSWSAARAFWDANQHW